MRRVESLDTPSEEEAQAGFPRDGVLEEERSGRPSETDGPPHEQISHDRIVTHLYGKTPTGVPGRRNKGSRGPVRLQTDLVVDDQLGFHAGRARAVPKDGSDDPAETRPRAQCRIQPRAQRRRGVSMTRDGSSRRTADPRKTAGVVDVGADRKRASWRSGRLGRIPAMHWLFTPAAGILFSATALALVAAGLMWNRRSVPGGILLFLLMLGVAEYTLVSGLEAASATLFWKNVWAKLEYVGSGAVSTLLLLFAVKYTGHERWLRGGRRYAVWIIPVANVAAVSTNELHHWIWTGFLPGAPGTNALVYLHGPGFYLAVSALYAYLGIACFLLVGAAVRPVVIRRRQSVTVLLGTLFPLAAGVLYILGITPLAGLDLVPIACFFSAGILIASVGAFRVFDLVPIARDALVEEMSDAVLVVDAGRRLADLNPAARRLLGLDSTAVGRRAADVVAAWREIESRCCGEQGGHAELALGTQPPLFADVRASPLLGRDRRASGFLIVLRDITARHAAEMEVQDANRRLELHVERIEALQTELREQAIRDALTGLFNRRYLDETLPRDIERASYDHSAFSAVMLDIDHFKQVNDRYGHEEGDRMLEILGRLLRERTRPGDIACRYGGEEFVVILVQTPLDVARARAEDLLAAFRELSGKRGHPVTLSAGVAAFPTHGQTQDDLLRATDEALYAAKLAGRNCVRVPT